MITMFIIIFFGTVYLLGWLAIIILKGIVGAIGNRLYCTPNNRIPYRSLCIETCVACYSFQNTEIPYD